MPPETYNIFVNKRKFETPASSLKAREIMQLAGLNPDEHDLFLVTGEGRGTKYGPDDAVTIQNGMHFNAIARGVNFG